jgi:esterase/lipase superfamily enzyme
MQKETWSWASARLATLPHPTFPASVAPGTQATARVSRWGHYGTPVLLFPSAGGDIEEVERFHLVGSIKGLVESGRVKVFSVDGLAAHAWLRGTATTAQCVASQRVFEEFVYEEVVPLIRRDCHSDTIEILTAGAAFGAFSAAAMLCRYSNVFRGAIALSSTFDLAKFLPEPSHAAARPRFVQIASGEGDFEQPLLSRQLAQALTSFGVPNRLDLWGRNFPHSWSTWREMLPKYLAELA